MKNRIIAFVVGMVLGSSILFSSSLNNRIIQSCDPDSFGSDGYYIWLDIYEPGGPVYNWIDIASVGTKVQGLTDDNNAGPFQIGFDFPYYGYYVHEFWINSNGAISFSDGTVYVPQGSSGFIIPSTNAPNGLLIPLGGDLTFETDSAECYYYSNNIDTFVVSYINVAAWDTAGPMGSHSFQIMLTRQDSCLYFQYSRQEGQLYNNAVVAGIECVVGYRGMQVFAGAVPDSGYAIKFIPIDSASILQEYEDRKPKARDIWFTCHPNPFTTSTTVILPSTGHRAKGIELQIFDVTGRRVRDFILHPLSFILGVTWNGRDEAGKVLPPGIYFLKLNDKPVGKVVKVR